ncbi:hypothetical protein BJF78_32235 [Pseudonocardia sp. CNS-139]|nr:hypothetical protein BJF78_32235 [Pseudonocardia sp. CNS-139]
MALSLPRKVNRVTGSELGSAGADTSVVDGGVVSGPGGVGRTSHVWAAGVGSTRSAGSSARTSKVCGPLGRNA